MSKMLTTRRARAKRVGEALNVYRERNAITFEALEGQLAHAGYGVSLSTLKRLATGVGVPHGTTLAAVETFLKNAGAARQIGVGERVPGTGGKKPRRKPRGESWAPGSR